MSSMKKNISSVIFATAIIIAAYLLANAFVNRNKSEGIISVTGLGKADFTSSYGKVHFQKKVMTYRRHTMI